MDPKTASIYEDGAERWIEYRHGRARQPVLRRLAHFAKRVEPGGVVADLGSGPGWYAASLQRRGFQAIALDLSRGMLRNVPRRSRAVARVQADLAHLPFARESLDGVFAINCLQHLPIDQLCLAVTGLHDAMKTGAPFALTVCDLDARGREGVRSRAGVGAWRIGGAMAGRLFTAMSAARAEALFARMGFAELEVARPRGEAFWLWIRGRRRYTLPDYIRPGLELLVCGLNPSLYAADTGVPFGRPGNRFWPAARRAGLCEREFDPWAALEHGLGFTDLVKRPTRGAAELRSEEYAEGLAALTDCVAWARPKALCFVGLDGWRRVVDRGAQPGWIRGGVAGRPAYLMPSTSGLNARTPLDALVGHLRTARRGP